MTSTSVPIPRAGTRTRAWRQEFRGGTVDDRRVSQVVASVPARIAEIDLTVPASVSVLTESAIGAMSRLDADHRLTLTPLSYLLLRSESIASSKIEHEEATIDDFVRALHGVRSNRSASSMAAATGALDYLASGDLGTDSLTHAHELLMREDESEAHYAGRFRPMQNWIGGSDHSPRGAIYVPPPPDLVDDLVEDLIAFTARTDVPALAQAAIAHSQFEAIHPFTDGNGRIGRALAAGILRARAVTTAVTVPIAAALVEVRSRYFAGLNAFHEGDAGEIIALWARASIIAAEESRTTAGRLEKLFPDWMQTMGSPRETSATGAVLGFLQSIPVATNDDLEDELGLSTSSISRVVKSLEAVGIVRGMTERKRNQVWGATEVLAELEDLGVRIGARARAEL